MATKSKTSSKFLPSLLSSSIIKDVPMGQVQQTVEIKQTLNPPFQYKETTFEGFYNAQTQDLQNWIDQKIIRTQTKYYHDWIQTAANYLSPTQKAIPSRWLVQKIMIIWNLAPNSNRVDIMDTAFTTLFTLFKPTSGVIVLDFPQPYLYVSSGRNIFPVIDGSMAGNDIIQIKIIGYSEN